MGGLFHLGGLAVPGRGEGAPLPVEQEEAGGALHGRRMFLLQEREGCIVGEEGRFYLLDKRSPPRCVIRRASVEEDGRQRGETAAAYVFMAPCDCYVIAM